jgi:hypothetical protein
MRIFAATAILPAAATIYFFVFWRWFDHRRRHRVAAHAMMFGTFVVIGAATYLLRGVVFAIRVDVPMPVQVIGWVIVAIAMAVGFWADRQIGFRVRSFTPFFERGERIRLARNREDLARAPWSDASSARFDHDHVRFAGTRVAPARPR